MAAKICADCKFYLVRGVCPRAEYKKRDLNIAACSPSDKACELFQPKYKPKNNEELDMAEALKHLNGKYVFKVPTDTEEILGYEEGQYKPYKCAIKHELKEFYGDNLKRNFVDEVLAHIQWKNYIERKKINKFTNKIPIQNGYFNFVTHDVEPFTPEEIFTYKLNVIYDPEAQCPNFLKFLAEILPDENDRKLLQEIAGYCLLPAMPFHKLFWFYGVGRNGKDRIILTLEHILGEENNSHLNLGEFREGRRFSLCQLYGKLLNVSNEPDSKYPIQTNILKLISGENTINAEIKGKNQRLQFTNKAKIVVVGNSFPKVEDSSIGFWERVEVLNFPRSFAEDETIQNIERQWLEKPNETSGVFNWMLEGLYRLQENGVFSTSKTIEETKAEFMRVSDPFRSWLNDCCVFLTEAYLTRKEAYNSYKDYSDELGATPDSERTFYGKMRKTPKIRDTRIRIKNGLARVFQGITLKAETEEDKQQTKFESVPDVPDSSYPSNFENSLKVEKNKKLGTSGTFGTPSIDIEKYFPKGQYPVCFICHKSVVDLNDLTNIDGLPCHVMCKRTLEDQRRGEASS